MSKYVLILFYSFLIFCFFCCNSKELTEYEKNIEILNSPNFQIGDVFVYEINYKFNPLYYRTQASKRLYSTTIMRETFKVAKIMTLNDKEVYLIEVNSYNKFDQDILNYEIYIDKNNGEILKNALMESMEITGLRLKYTEILGFYEPWMLKLKPDSSFTIKELYKVPVRSNGTGFKITGEKSFMEGKINLKVERIEKWNNKKCFVVTSEIEMPVEKKNGKEVYEKMDCEYFIDAEKRIIVKQIIKGDVTREKTIMFNNK